MRARNQVCDPDLGAYTRHRKRVTLPAELSGALPERRIASGFEVVFYFEIIQWP
jgi:hypothetical protein